jgi:hypothetical protein
VAECVFPWETSATGKRQGRTVRVPPNAVVPYPLAQRIVGRQYLWLRVCPSCGRNKLFLATKATCGGSCGVALSHWRRPHQERRMRELHRLAMAVRLQRQQERMAREVEGLTPAQAYAKGYERGYATGHSARRKGTTRLRDKVGTVDPWQQRPERRALKGAIA